MWVSSGKQFINTKNFLAENTEDDPDLPNGLYCMEK